MICDNQLMSTWMSFSVEIREQATFAGLPTPAAAITPPTLPPVLSAHASTPEIAVVMLVVSDMSTRKNLPLFEPISAKT